MRCIHYHTRFWFWRAAAATHCSSEPTLFSIRWNEKALQCVYELKHYTSQTHASSYMLHTAARTSHFWPNTLILCFCFFPLHYFLQCFLLFLCMFLKTPCLFITVDRLSLFFLMKNWWLGLNTQTFFKCVFLYCSSAYEPVSSSRSSTLFVVEKKKEERSRTFNIVTRAEKIGIVWTDFMEQFVFYWYF